ncbi:TRAP transporter large permease [Metabacillus halosaccharovorans]|uniref:TRAP transporter large permease n=1 Tax=Metabacillus halosaccharovorans TaxID=930124 RepID=A0ABT3DBH9_9BACI|nr:TRAP transporter large permease [Metabacillus halosaccharovorans]MCV9884415.1 TRAP transporter large permease [Metabacillus halosaccharovorans]
MLILLIASLFGLLLLGVPVGFSLLGSSLIAILAQGTIPLQAIPQRLALGLDSFPMLAIPLFILAGTLMEAGGITKRLITLSEVLVGHIRGSLAHVTVVSNVFMSGVSGSGVADAAATGSALIPSMIKRGYGKGFAAAILGASATVGPIIPPSIPMILYGSLAGVSIGKLFLGGAIPGLLMSGSLMIVSYMIARKRGFEKRERARLKEIIKAFRDALWALLMPVIIVGGIFTGFFTATESAVIAVIYSLIIGLFVYKDLKIKELPKKLLEAVSMSSSIGVIIAASAPFAWVMAYAQGPAKVLAMFQSISDSTIVALLLLMLILLILGCFLDGMAIIIITTPVIMPILAQFNIDPLHFGVILAINVMIGTITPPVGTLMYVAISIAKTSVFQFTKEVWPFFLVLVLLLAIFALFPQLVLFLPNLLMK